MTIKFTIPGNPRGKERPRHNKKTGHTYTPKETKEYEQLVAWAYRQKYHGFRFPDKTPLVVIVNAYIPIPKSDSKKDRAAKIAGTVRPTVKPDVDNFCKIVLDSLGHGIAFDDDKCVVDSAQHKIYSLQPRVEVMIREASPLGDTKGV